MPGSRSASLITSANGGQPGSQGANREAERPRLIPYGTIKTAGMRWPSIAEAGF